MKKNSERIMKYLSDLMDKDEKTAFEAELNSSAELKSEFESFNNVLGEMKLNDVDADERYFTSLLPNARTKIEKKPKLSFIPRLSLAVPSLVIVAAIGFFMFRHNIPNDISSATLVQEIVKNISDEKVSQKYLTELELDVNHAYDISEDGAMPKSLDLDESTKQKILTMYESPIPEEMLSAQRLSEDELKTIYTKIGSKNTY